MAHIRRHPKSPDRWQVRYVDPSGRERSKNFSKKSEAEKFLHSVEADKLRGVWVDPQHGRIAFGDWAAQVEGTRLNRRASTRARDASYLRSLILPTFNDRQLGTIQPNEIREWIADLEDRDYSPATIAKAFQIVSRCFRVAVSDGVIARTPCREIKLPTNDRDERRFLSPTEVEQLAVAMKDRYRLVVLTGAYTGLRFGELAALRLDDLDLLRRTIRVDEQLSRQGSSRMTPGPLKSKKAYRTIGIPTFLAEDLAAHLSAFPSSTDFVFSHESGGPLDYGRFRRRHWHPAVELSIGEPCTPHDLRHTHVAMLIADGQSPRYIADRLGHKSTRTVLDVYGHLYEDADEAVMEGLERLRGAAQTDTRRIPDGHQVISLDRDAARNQV
ncbi:MAG TPA: tyrosine-type recombinase/integrase [Acidimicrobiia bacterium]|nr:tyrosine-type recombinase/integrase [Acidimicrobiia bacterium]